MTCTRIKALAYSVMRDSQIREFEAERACDLAIALGPLGRFRVNVFRQRAAKWLWWCATSTARCRRSNR